ncbi:hypothetical protein KR215_010477, partial [Drosophila sulfurigaster]
FQLHLSNSWHVRTKENIARVRRDEAAAQEDEKKRCDKLELAESEARINFLRSRTGVLEKKITTTAPCESETRKKNSHHLSTPSVSFNLFADYKSHIKKTNKDLEKEKKEEQEKYEKQIGYLTYLGQDTNEALKVRSWYEVAPKRSSESDNKGEETQSKQKLSQDPLTLINSLISTDKQFVAENKLSCMGTCTSCPESKLKSIGNKRPKKSYKKDKKHKHKSYKNSDKISKKAAQAKRDKLNNLRKERLIREATEQRRQEQLFAQRDSEFSANSNSSSKTPTATPRIIQKYNSQFNPEFAKQNMA